MTAPYISPLAQNAPQRRLGGGSGTYTQGPSALRPLSYGQQPDEEDPNKPKPARAPAGSAPQAGQPAAQPAPTFAELAAQGRARPAPPPGYGGMQTMAAPAQGAPGAQGGADPQVAEQTRQAVLQMLGQPSTYDSDAVQRSYGRLSQDIDDQYKQNATAVDEEMARRGIYDSTIAGGRLHDLNIGQRGAKEELATQLLTQQAQTMAQDRVNALQAALGYQGQQSDQDLQRQQLALQGELGRGSLGIDQGRLALDTQLGQGNLALGQQQLAQSGSQFDRSLSATTRAQDLDRALQQTLGLGNLDVAKQNANTSATGVANQYDLGLKNYGLDVGRLGEDARQFNATNSLAQVQTLGDLDLRRAGLLQNDAQFGANLAQRANEFGASDFRQSQSLGLQDSAQRIALAQSQAQILAQIAAMPGFASLPDTQKQAIMSSISQAGPGAANNTIDGRNPYLTAQYPTTSIYQPLAYTSPLQGWNPNYGGLLSSGSGTSGYQPFRPYVPPTYTPPAGGGASGGGFTPSTPTGGSGTGLPGGVGGFLGNGGQLGNGGLSGYGGLPSFTAAPMPAGGGSNGAPNTPNAGSNGSNPSATPASSWNPMDLASALGYLGNASARYGMTPNGTPIPGATRPASVGATSRPTSPQFTQQGNLTNATTGSLEAQDNWWMPQQAGYVFNPYTNTWDDPNSAAYQQRDQEVTNQALPEFYAQHTGDPAADQALWDKLRQKYLDAAFGGAAQYSSGGNATYSPTQLH